MLNSDSDQRVLVTVSSSVEENLKSLQINMKASVDSQDISNVSFETQRILSSKINLSNQIDLILRILNYSVVKLSENEFDKILYSKMKVSKEETLQNLVEKLSVVQNSLDYLSKSELVELKAYRSPPQAVVTVAEATCILFGKTPSYANFLKLLSKSDFISEIKNYDINSVSEFAVTGLEKYVNEPSFNPDYINQISKVSSILCSWVTSVYSYSKSVASLDSSSLVDGSYSTVSDYLFEKSFFMFSWHLYYNDGLINTERKLDDLIKKKTQLKDQPIVTIQEYIDIFEKEEVGKEFTNLAEKHAKAEAAKVRSNTTFFFF